MEKAAGGRRMKAVAAWAVVARRSLNFAVYSSRPASVGEHGRPSVLGAAGGELQWVEIEPKKFLISC